MKRKLYVAVLFTAWVGIACTPKKDGNYESAKQGQAVLHTYTNPTPHEVFKIKMSNEDMPVKNIILMIGDGMGLNVVQAAWVANKGQLYMDNAAYTGLMKTTAKDSIITDSAAAGTAMATGEKTNRGILGVTPEGLSLKTICEYAHDAGMGTGVLSTARIYDATPSAFSVENIDRDASEEIAEAYIHCNVDFVLGGGKKYFNQREDKIDLLPLLREKGYQVITSMQGLDSINENKVFALIANHDMPTVTERGDDLWIGTEKALATLSKNKAGFFLMVESAIIDDHGHGNNLPKMMEETLDFDRTVGKVLEWAATHPETLVIVTADHATGGLTLTEGEMDKAKIKGYYSSGHHDGVMVPVYAFGAGAKDFTGVYDNTDLFDKMKTALGL